MNRFTIPSRFDFVSSLVVFVIALPLTLGIAVASGASATSGILSAMIGGIIVGLISGAPLAVSGPAAGLSALVFMIIQEHGIMGLAIATLIGGLFQMIMGGLRLGFIFTYVPKSILDGMLAAIGIIILFGQIHVYFGGSVPSTPWKSIIQIPSAAVNASLPVLILGSIGFAIQILWTKYAGKMKWIPGALPAVLLVTLIGLGFENIPRVALAPLGEALNTQLQLLSKFGLSDLNFSIIAVGLGLGLVASAESLLCARAVDCLAAARGIAVKSNLDRELLAQGAGNTICGALGALPITAVIVRSAANVESGAKGRWSTILHGLWIMIFVLALPLVLNAIPLTVLATVLILTGWKLMNLKKIISEAKTQSLYTSFWAITIFAILATDLLKGLIIALVTFAAYSMYTKMRTPKSAQEDSQVDSPQRAA